MTAAILDRLDGMKSTGPDRWLARCPAHDDKSPSLSIRLVDDRLLVHCFAGCDALDIVHALGLELSDLFEDSRPVDHRQRPTHRRIPARDLLLLIEHEVTVVAILAADFLEKKTFGEADWSRLAQCVERIGRARHG